MDKMNYRDAIVAKKTLKIVSEMLKTNIDLGFDWHDLEMHPIDLPKDGSTVLITDGDDYEVAVFSFVRNVGWTFTNPHDGAYDDVNDEMRTKAWKYIEPFDVDYRTLCERILYEIESEEDANNEDKREV